MAEAPITVSQLGTSGVNALLTRSWDDFRAIKRNKGNPLAKLTKKVSVEPGQLNQVITIPLYPEIASNLLTDGDAVTLNNDTGSYTTLTLNKHRETTWSWTQIAAGFSTPSQIAGQLAARIAGLVNDIQSDVLSMITTGFTTNTAGTYNTALTEAVVVEAVADIMGNKPNDDVLTCLISPDLKAWGALAQLAAFRNFDNRGTVNNITGEGSVVSPAFRAYGVDWHVCHGLPISGTSRDNVVFDKMAMAYAMQPIALPMSQGVLATNLVDSEVAIQIVLHYDGDRLADQFTAHALYGYAIAKEPWGCLLIS